MRTSWFYKEPILVSLIAAILTPMVSLAAGNPSVQPMERTLRRPMGSERRAAACALDEGVYDASGDVYEDLRLFDGTGQAVPYVVRARTKTTRHTRNRPVSMVKTGLETLPDGGIRILLRRTQKGGQPDRVRLLTHEKDFEKLVSVWGRTGDAEWVSLADSTPIFDYSRFIDIRETSVPIRRGNYSSYRIEMSNMSEDQQTPLSEIVREMRGGVAETIRETRSYRRRDFRIDEVEFTEVRSEDKQGARVECTYTTSDFSVANTDDGRQTIVRIQTRRPPLTGLELSVDDANFSRTVHVEGSDALGLQASWKRVANQRITSIRTGSYSMRKVRIAFRQPVRFRHYRLTVANMDSPPLSIQGVTGYGDVNELVFFVDEADTYTLHYGDKELSAPRYDIADVLRKLKSSDADEWELGRELITGAPRQRFRLMSGMTFLVGCVILMVAVLFTLIRRVAGDIDES